jgi:O-6-methylguanine DNA methyltransferase
VHGIELNNFIPEAQEKPNLGAQSLVDRVIKGEPVPIMLHGTPFQERVWEAVKAIPSGTVVSYSWIADRIGAPKAVRAVGTAIGQNPVTLAIPCHRVIRSNGNIGGYRWGLDIKEKILKGEGIFFKDGYRVSSKKDFERFSKENTLI